MSVAPVPARPAPRRRRDTHRRLASWAVRISAVSAAILAVAMATVAIVYAAGGEGAIEDTWLGALIATMAVVGLLGSLASFSAAIVARLRRERWALLWLPLLLFPAAFLFVVLGEAFWWE